MRPGIALYLLVIIVLHCSSCTSGTGISEKWFDDIEAAAFDHPDSALNILRGIDPADIRSKKNKARYHLLHSIALDKNGIDITSDSIINPAIRFYSARKASRNQFLTYYYAGRVCENMGDHPSAMEYLAKAENIICTVENSEAGALLYATKGRIYNNLLEYENAAINLEQAAAEYRSAGNEGRYISNKLRAADCMVLGGDIESAWKIISEFENKKAELSQANLSKYYLTLLRITEKREPEQSETILNEYLDQIRFPSMIDWLHVAGVHISNGKADQAIDALQQHRTHDGTDASYHYRMGQALEMKSMFRESLDEFKKYDRMSGAIGRRILENDTRFVEEREMHLQMHEKARNQRSMLYLTIAVTLLALGFATAAIVAGLKQLKIRGLEKENLTRQIDELLLEREELAMLEYRNRQGKKIITERLRIIDQFVISDAFNDSLYEAKATETLKKIISDRAEFVRQNRLIFNQSAARFIAFLSARGLTEIEIDHCCLYAIGMNGKMVMTFTNAKRHYHIGSDVRKKLGLGSHDTNISIYIRQLYHRLEGGEQ